jgi:hypothetical protein
MSYILQKYISDVIFSNGIIFVLLSLHYIGQIDDLEIRGLINRTGGSSINTLEVFRRIMLGSGIVVTVLLACMCKRKAPD